MASFRQARVDRGHTRLFHDLLAEADLVKFAKLRPLVDQAHAAVTQARHIVDVTKIVEPDARDPDIQDTEAQPRSEARITNHEPYLGLKDATAIGLGLAHTATMLTESDAQSRVISSLTAL